MSVEATSATGAAFGFSASATDTVDGVVAATCTPASGTTFPLGATTVSCTAADAHGNHGAADLEIGGRFDNGRAAAQPERLQRQSPPPHMARAFLQRNDARDGVVLVRIGVDVP